MLMVDVACIRMLGVCVCVSQPLLTIIVASVDAMS